MPSGYKFAQMPGPARTDRSQFLDLGRGTAEFPPQGTKVVRLKLSGLSEKIVV